MDLGDESEGLDLDIGVDIATSEITSISDQVSDYTVELEGRTGR